MYDVPSNRYTTFTKYTRHDSRLFAYTFTRKTRSVAVTNYPTDQYYYYSTTVQFSDTRSCKRSTRDCSSDAPIATNINYGAIVDSNRHLNLRPAPPAHLPRHKHRAGPTATIRYFQNGFFSALTRANVYENYNIIADNTVADGQPMVLCRPGKNTLSTENGVVSTTIVMAAFEHEAPFILRNRNIACPNVVANFQTKPLPERAHRVFNVK